METLQLYRHNPPIYVSSIPNKFRPLSCGRVVLWTQREDHIVLISVRTAYGACLGALFMPSALVDARASLPRLGIHDPQLGRKDATFLWKWKL